MSKINGFLMMLIAMVAIMIAAVGVDKGIKYKETKKWEAEREIYYAEAREKIAEKQLEIQTLAQDQDALIAYIEENQLDHVERDPDELLEDRSDAVILVSEEEMQEETVSGDDLSDDMVDGEMVSENDLDGMSVSGNEYTEETVSGNSVSENTVSGNSVSGNSVSGNTVSGNSVSGNTVSGNGTKIYEIIASYQNTIETNLADRKLLAESEIDFSDKKIACLGDSITEAINLDHLENFKQYAYPARLQEALQAKEVVNLGIGGSSIGRYWADPFVERYQEIPKDTDLILVMGGTNDGFCVSEEEFGTMEERSPRTFIGDLDELMRGLKKDYPDAEIVFITPLPNVLQDILRRDREQLLPQSAFVKAIRELAAEYEYPVIDLYYANFLDTHDAAVIHAFMPDGVHGNEAGYKMLAEHIGAELIRMEQEKLAVSEEGFLKDE